VCALAEPWFPANWFHLKAEGCHEIVLARGNYGFETFDWIKTNMIEPYSWAVDFEDKEILRFFFRKEEDATIFKLFFA